MVDSNSEALVPLLVAGLVYSNASQSFEATLPTCGLQPRKDPGARTADHMPLYPGELAYSACRAADSQAHCQSSKSRVNLKR